jgi:hypothetical protein
MTLRGEHPLEQRLKWSKSPDDAVTQFLQYAEEKKLQLYPAQEEAILELFGDSNVILNTPTGSGKSMVALALHFASLSAGRRSVYTCPIKALVNEKFLWLCREFGPDHVGLATGDATVNREAPILVCTAEVLANFALLQGSHFPIDDIVIDEFHYYSDRERGVAWQLPLLELSRARFLLMSATLGETDFFEAALTRLTRRPTQTVRSLERPVPLDFEYSDTPLELKIERLVAGGNAPIYLVCFTQRNCAEVAGSLMSQDLCTKLEKAKITEELAQVRFNSPYGKELYRFLKQGIGLHHAGLLPKYRVIVEKLAQKGLLKVICGTDTLGVGVNVPIRTVVFTQLCKFDGEKVGLLKVRDFHQIAGRAGRRGFDSRGLVVAQAPEHVIENIKIDQKIAEDPKKAKKLVKRRPPEKGFVPWSRETFEKFQNSQPEALESRFKLNHGMVLQVLSRTQEDGCAGLQRLIRNCHESDYRKKKLRKEAFVMFRALVERGIIEVIPKGERNPQTGVKLRVHADLQADFSLHTSLSLFLVDVAGELDPESDTFALDLLSLVESVIEDPEPILRKQKDRVIQEKLDELKAQGMDFDQRMQEIEGLEHPKPLADIIYPRFNEFCAKHPWVGQDHIRPKSIAREMVEGCFSFADYVREYDLHRSEGILLRYLSSVYKALEQTVPEGFKSEEIRACEFFLGSTLRQTDSSLLEEWERMKDPLWAEKWESRGEPGPGQVDAGLSRQEKGAITDTALKIQIRSEVVRRLRLLKGALGTRDYSYFIEGYSEGISGEAASPTEGELRDSGKVFSDTVGPLRLDPAARAPHLLRISERSTPEGVLWRVEQQLLDPQGEAAWGLVWEVDPLETRNRGVLAWRLLQFASLEALVENP